MSNKLCYYLDKEQKQLLLNRILDNVIIGIQF